MKKLKKHQLITIGSSIAAIYGVLCLVAFASAASRTEKPAPVDAEQFADFMEHEVLDIQDLAEGAEVQRRMFNRITPPGLSWTQPMFPPVAPFDAQYFDDQFLAGLLGEDKNSVVIYPLSLIQDPKTRETLIYNADGEMIAAIPVDGATRKWPADADPSRVILQLDLLPAEDVEPYLYTERRIEETLARYNAPRSAKSGGAATRGLEAGEFGFADMQILSNGNVQLTVTNGADVAEIFAYTVWHTSSVSVVVWTNENDEVITSTNIHWHQVSPAFDGLESEWECLMTNLALTNGLGVYEDANISSNARIRFYAVANRQDTDGDGLTDGMEIFVHHTNPGNPDTDGDGHSDGREIALGTDPLDDGDFFGIVINAALPIPPPPGSEVGREWVELFNVGQHAKSLAGFRLQTARPSGWTNVFTFPPGTVLGPGDFMVIGNGTNGDFQAKLYMPNSSFTPAGLFGIRLVKPEPVFHVADALFYGFTNEYGFSLDGFGEQLPILRPRTNWVIRRTWIGYDTDHAGDWKNVSAALWIPHTQGNYLDLDGDGLSNAAEIAGGLFPLEGGTRIDEVDSDFDGLSDAAETALGTDPNNVDTDGDAFPWDANYPPCGNDADEVTSGTDPLDSDCDNDGIPDGWELASPVPSGQKSTDGILNPLSPDSNGNGMPDGDEDSDDPEGDGIPNAVEVDNLTNPFDADDVDPRPYLWLKNGDIANGTIDEDDIGYGTILIYHIKARTNCPPIMVRVIEGGHVIEKFSVSCTASYQWLNPDEFPYTNRVYCITPNGKTNFMFKIIDGRTTWENENPSEYGADIVLRNAPAILDIDAGVPEASEESVGFLLADKSAHPDALRRPLSIAGPENTWGYASNIVLSYDTVRLRIYDLDGNVLDSGTQFYEGDYIPAMEVEGLTHSESMRDAWIEVEATGIPLSDRVTATVLKADIGTVAPLANRTLHPDAAREPLLLKQTLPADWNGLMQFELTEAAAFWTPTGGMPIVLSETVFTNAQLPQTIYLEGDGCGMGEASFSVVGLSDCVTSIPLQIFGANATLAGVAEADEESPGGFIADRTVHTNAPRTMLTLEACGPYGAPGNLVLTWDPSLVNIYTAPSGGTALTQFVTPFHGFNGTNLYVEGVAPGTTALSWSYSGQTNCTDNIQVSVFKVDLTNIKFNHDTASSASDAINIRQDYTTPIDISNGEWVKGGANHPVVYTADNSVTIKARFTVQPDSITSVDIWAVSIDSNGSLGDVVKTAVIFSGGVSLGDANGYVEFPVSGNTPNVVKKTTVDAWQWKAENINGASVACNFDASGPHTVYTVLNEPMPPWNNTFGNQRNAWVKALIFAIETAGGQNKTDSDALAAITSYLHTGHGLTYDIVAGDSTYASSYLGGTMQLTKYMDKSLGNIVNCYDQASGVCALGTLLGIDVTYRFMDPFGYINTVNLVGEGNCNNPFYGNPNITGGKIADSNQVEYVRAAFGNHAFANYKGCTYDACVGPHTGTKTEAQYVADTVDTSTPAEANPPWCAPKSAGDIANIIGGSVSNLQ